MPHGVQILAGLIRAWEVLAKFREIERRCEGWANAAEGRIVECKFQISNGTSTAFDTPRGRSLLFSRRVFGPILH